MGLVFGLILDADLNLESERLECVTYCKDPDPEKVIHDPQHRLKTSNFFYQD
jgi:hypothetical protein